LSALYVATFGSDSTARCSAAGRAAMDAATGRASVSDADIAKALDRLTTDARRAAAAVPNCRNAGTGA
jgi:hypothetical protein